MIHYLNHIPLIDQFQDNFHDFIKIIINKEVALNINLHQSKKTENMSCSKLQKHNVSILQQVNSQMILQTSENTVDYQPSIQTHRGRTSKLDEDCSKICENRSGHSKRSRFTSNSKLVKNNLFQTIQQRNQIKLQVEIEQRNLQIQLLSTASENLSRDRLANQHQIGHSFLRMAMVGQLALTKLALR